MQQCPVPSAALPGLLPPTGSPCGTFMKYSAQPPSSTCFVHAFPSHSLAARLDACEEGGLFGAGMWDCLEAKGSNNIAGKQWQDAELFL